MRYSAKKRVERAEIALHKVRARAAAILHAEGLHGSSEEPHSTYVFKILRHRETGVRVRVLDTQAVDAPPTDGADVVHRYEVQCQTHDTRGPSFASARAALTSARRSWEWCAPCAGLMAAPPKPRRRAAEPEPARPENAKAKANPESGSRSQSEPQSESESDSPGEQEPSAGKHARRRRDDVWP